MFQYRHKSRVLTTFYSLIHLFINSQICYTIITSLDYEEHAASLAHLLSHIVDTLSLQVSSMG